MGTSIGHRERTPYNKNFARWQGQRAQIDRVLYKRHIQADLFKYHNLQIRAGSVFDLILEDNTLQPGPSDVAPLLSVKGVRLGTNWSFFNHGSTPSLILKQIMETRYVVRRLWFVREHSCQAKFILVSQDKVAPMLYSTLTPYKRPEAYSSGPYKWSSIIGVVIFAAESWLQSWPLADWDTCSLGRRLNRLWENGKN